MASGCGSFAKLARRKGWLGGASAAKDTAADKEEARSRSPSGRPHRMLRRPASPQRSDQRQSGITGAASRVGMAGLGVKAGDLYNPLFDERPESQPLPGMGMVRPANLQLMPGVPGALPSFSALPGPPGGPSTSTAIVKLGVMDMAPRKMPDPSLQKGPICINFVAGACMSSRECGRWHPEDMNEVAHLLEIWKRKPCKFGKSCRWPRCVFWHPEDGPLPDLPGDIGTKGFTGFTGLVPAAGTEPGAFQKPVAGERLMVWNGARGMPEQQQAAKLEVPAPTDAAQMAGSQASVAEAPRASSEEPPVAASRPAREGHMELPKESKKKQEAQPAQEVKKQKKQIEEQTEEQNEKQNAKQNEEQNEEGQKKQIEDQNEEIQRLRSMLSNINGPQKLQES